MTREEAHKAALDAKAQWGGGSSESWLINCLVAFGLLKLDEPQPPTLWELLRKHGLDVGTAQHICNEAMLKGVRVPRDGPHEGQPK